MMMIKTIKSGKAHSFWLLLPVMLFLLSGCSKESSEDPEPGSTYAPVKFSLDIVSPEMGSTLLASVAEGGQINTRFYSRMNEGASKTILVRQDGKMINLGKLPVTLTNTSGTEGRIEIDGTDKVDAKKSYDVFVLGCSARWDDSDVYYKTNMSRAGSFGTWLKFSSSYRPSKATSNIAGTDEILFVINKSGAPIKFKHKGFDADKKWYYKYAEVSMDNGKVVASEDGEVEGVETDVPVFTGSNARGIYSIYVPNGNKIQDAQLIAEIDGVEVRSTNRISSDIMIQQNQSYAMFAVWDGEQLKLGDDINEPAVLDITNPGTSGIVVTSLESDGTMTIETTEDKAPKVGDILCSGPTEIAPYGFMLRVTDVIKDTRSSSTRALDNEEIWKLIIRSAGAALNEVLSNFHYEKHIDFDKIKVDKVFDNEGNVLQLIEENPKEWKIPMKLDLGPYLTITPDIIIKPKDLVVYVDVEDKAFKKFGADIDLDVDMSLQIDAKLSSKFEKSISLYYIIFEPIEICAEPPIVITPLFQVYLTFSADGQIKLSCIPVRNTYEIKAGACFDFGQEKIKPSNGNKFYTIREKENKERTANAIEGGLTFNGSAKASLGASISIGIDGCNYVGRVDFLPKKLDVLADMLALEFTYDLNREISTTIGIDNINTDAWDDFHFYDGCKIENYFHAQLQFFLRVWNPFKGEFVGLEPKIDPEGIHFWEDELYPTLFVPDYQRISARLYNGDILLNVAKYKPYFWNTLFKEQSYGFCYGKYVDKNSKITEWKNIAPTNIVGNTDDPLWYFDGLIPSRDLEKGCTYFVCPYSYGMAPDGSYVYLHRKGIYICYDSNGNLTYNTLQDIPGLDL